MSRPLKDLHLLPKVRDSWSYLYVEHAKIDQDQKAIAIHDANGKAPVPCASLTTLMLGPGTSITHAAIRSLADNGCLVIWSGEEGVRYYAQGMGETRSAQNLYRQAALWADPAKRLGVVYRMYRMRFAEPPSTSLSLQQLRGLEGVRVREAYARASRETGVEWKGRSYKRDSWEAAEFGSTSRSRKWIRYRNRVSTSTVSSITCLCRGSDRMVHETRSASTLASAISESDRRTCSTDGAPASLPAPCSPRNFSGGGRPWRNRSPTSSRTLTVSASTRAESAVGGNRALIEWTR